MHNDDEIDSTIEDMLVHAFAKEQKKLSEKLSEKSF